MAEILRNRSGQVLRVRPTKYVIDKNHGTYAYRSNMAQSLANSRMQAKYQGRKASSSPHVKKMRSITKAARISALQEAWSKGHKIKTKR